MNGDLPTTRPRTTFWVSVKKFASGSNLGSATGKGVLAIADQGFISGSNFILSIVLARTLTSSEYGVYALGFEVFLLLSIIYTSLILEPMSVFGPSVYRDHSAQYSVALVRIHAVASVVIVVSMAAAACFAHFLAPGSSLAGALVGVGVASPLILLYWIARRAFYVKLSPRGALSGGVVYFVVMACGLILLYSRKLLSPISAFLLMAAGAGLAGLTMLRALKLVEGAGNAGPNTRDILRRHWVYGRWALASAVPGWFFSGAIYYPLIGVFGGLAETGQLKAVFNLNSPITQTFVAVSMLSLPYASRVYHRDGSRSVKSLIWRLSLVYFAGTTLYWAALLIFRTPAVHALYGDKYELIPALLPWVALGSIFRITASAQANVLRAMELTALVCRVYAVVGAIAILVGVPAIWLFGIRGAIYTFALSGIAASVYGLFTVLHASSSLGAEAGRDRCGMLSTEELPVVSRD